MFLKSSMVDIIIIQSLLGQECTFLPTALNPGLMTCTSQQSLANKVGAEVLRAGTQFTILSLLTSSDGPDRGFPCQHGSQSDDGVQQGHRQTMLATQHRKAMCPLFCESLRFEDCYNSIVQSILTDTNNKQIKVKVAARKSECHEDEIWMNNGSLGLWVYKEWRVESIHSVTLVTPPALGSSGPAWGRGDKDLTGHVTLLLVWRVYLLLSKACPVLMKTPHILVLRLYSAYPSLDLRWRQRVLYSLNQREAKALGTASSL